MKKILLALAICGFAFSASANNTKSNGLGQEESLDLANMTDLESISEGFGITKSEASAPGHPGLPKPCAEANITAEQKKAIGEAIFASKRAQVQLMANVKMDMMDYGNNLVSDTGSSEEAGRVSGKLTTDVSALLTNHLELTNNIFFNILSVEQRKPAAMCAMMMKQMMMYKKMKMICNGIGGK